MSGSHTTEAAQPAYSGWVIVELMGRRQTAGLVSEVTLAGATMLRIGTPAADGDMVATQFYGGQAIYALTPCEESVARNLLAGQPYNLPPAVRLVLPDSPALPAPSRAKDIDDEYDDEDDL